LYQLGEIELGSINYLTGNCTDYSQIPLILSSLLNSIKFCLAYRFECIHTEYGYTFTHTSPLQLN